jgi:hypothetical protein
MTACLKKADERTNSNSSEKLQNELSNWNPNETDFAAFLRMH